MVNVIFSYHLTVPDPDCSDSAPCTPQTVGTCIDGKCICPTGTRRSADTLLCEWLIDKVCIKVYQQSLSDNNMTKKH